MAVTTLIPKCILEDEDIVTLRDMGIEVQEGSVRLGGCKVNCIKVINLTETQVFDRLEARSLLEAIDTESNSYVQRAATVVFMKLRQVATIQDRDQRCIATCSLLGAINSLAAIDPRTASRFLAILRGIN